jgi:hypothetical protein
MYARNHTGYIKWPLTTGSSDAPTWVAGSQIQYGFGNIPSEIDGIPLYLAGVRLEINGNGLVQSGGTGSRLAWDNFRRALIADMEIRNVAVMGTPVSLRNVLGAYLDVIEFVGQGYHWASPPRGFFPAANGTYAFTHPIHYNFGVGAVSKGHHVAELALFYKGAQMVLDPAAASVISGMSTGGSLTNMTIKATGLLLPEPELRFGPGMEWVDYQVVASSGLENTIRSFGNSTGLSNSQRGALLLQAHLLTSKNGHNGAFTGTQLTQLAVPWRNQPLTNQIGSFVDELIQNMGDRPVVGSVTDQASTQALSAFNGFPWAMGTDPSNDQVLNNDKIISIPLVSQGKEGQLTKAQEVGVKEGDVGLTLSGTFSGTQHLLCQQLKAWTPQAYDEAARLIVDTGLGRKLYGDRALSWDLKLQHKNPDAATIDPKKLKYLALKLAPKAA